MSLVLELSPEQEQRLEAEASRQGLSSEEYVLRIVEERIGSPVTEPGHLWRTLSPDEWTRKFTAWAGSVVPDTPVLPDEAFSRESMYEDERHNR
jgi:hypothetical protein